MKLVIFLPEMRVVSMAEVGRLHGETARVIRQLVVVSTALVEARNRHCHRRHCLQEKKVLPALLRLQLLPQALCFFWDWLS
jgi:hypothetical protein